MPPGVNEICALVARAAASPAGISRQEAAAILGIHVRSLPAALDELLLVGALPLSPDVCLDIEAGEDGAIRAHIPVGFERPARLTLLEAHAVRMALDAFARRFPAYEPDIEPLRAQLGRLTAPGDAEALDMMFRSSPPGDLAVPADAAVSAALTDAIQRRVEVMARYYAASRGAWREYALRPLYRGAASGYAYVAAEDASDGKTKTFREDRFGEVTVTGKRHHAKPGQRARPIRNMFAQSNDNKINPVLMRLGDTEATLAREAFGERLRPAGEAGLYACHAPANAWLFAQLASLGREAVVLEPPSAARAFADYLQALLGRYEAR